MSQQQIILVFATGLVALLWLLQGLISIGRRYLQQRHRVSVWRLRFQHRLADRRQRQGLHELTHSEEALSIDLRSLSAWTRVALRNRSAKPTHLRNRRPKLVL